MTTLYLTILIFVVLWDADTTWTAVTETPVGHLQPFGGHRPPDIRIDEIDDVPDPWTFWDKYVGPGEPLILRGAAKHSEAFSLWTEDYMMKEYGNLEVRLEGKSEANSAIPIGSEGLGRDKLRYFLKNYHHRDTYIVSQLPEPMYKDIAVLPCMSCGNMGGRIVETDLWMSSGNSQSILHKDAFNQMNCLLNGTKQWKFVHNKYEKYIHKTWEPIREIGGHSDIDVTSVDLIKYPDITKIRWANYTLNAGDCLFLPKSYYHQVNSFDSMNVAVSLLFSRIASFEDYGCDPDNMAMTSLADMYVLWSWPGHGVMSMGNMDVWTVRWRYSLYANETGMLTIETLYQEITDMLPEIDRNTIKERIDQAWKVIDPEGKGHLNVDEVLALDIPTLRNHVLQLEFEEPSNTPEFEYFFIDADDIKSLMMHIISNEGVLQRSSFIFAYTNDPEYAGSKEFAAEIFEKLSSENPDFATREEVVANADKALENWSLRELTDATPETDTSGQSTFWDDENEYYTSQTSTADREEL